MRVDEKNYLVEILKAGTLYRTLISEFERTFISEVGVRYAEFGVKTRVTLKQWHVAEQIGRKLNLQLGDLPVTVLAEQEGNQ